MPDVFNGPRVEAIPGTPLPYGLTSVANLILVDDLHELNGVHWLPMSCAEAYTTDWCGTAVPPKTFNGLDGATANPVAVYAGVDCPPIGMARDEAETYARAALAIGEPRALEAWVQTRILAPRAVNLTPTGPVLVETAMSLLEGALAVDYGGVGVIHVPAGASALVCPHNHVLRDGARTVTWLGNWVALGAGYQVANVAPDGTPAAAGTFWLYASGPVTIRQEQPQVPGDAKPVGRPTTGQPGVDDAPWEGVIDIRINDRLMLAERASVVQVECGVFAAQIQGQEIIS